MLIEPDRPELELGEVRLNPNLEQILADEQWIDDATGLVPHCLAVLKTCRYLTERLTALAMGAMHSSSGSALSQIVEVRNKEKKDTRFEQKSVPQKPESEDNKSVLVIKSIPV